MRNKFVAVLLTLWLAVSCLAAPAAATDADAMWSCSPITFYNQSGEQLAELIAGTTVTARVTVSSVGGQSGALMFAALLYEDNKLAAVDCDTKIAAADQETVYSVRITLPAYTEGVELNTLLWDSAQSMQPICNASLVPGGEGSTSLQSLIINGVPVEGFEPDKTEYTVEIAPNQTEVRVDYTTADGAAQVEVIQPDSYYDPFELKVTCPDGETRIYEITCRTAADLVGNLIHNANIPPDANRTTTFKHDLQELDPAFSDRSGLGAGVEAALIQLNNLPEELLGRDYIISPYQWQRDKPDGWSKLPTEEGYIKDWLRFDLRRSGSVEIYMTNINAAVSAAYLADGWINSENTNAFFSALGTNGNTANEKFTRKYTRHFTVGDQPENIYIRPGSRWVIALQYDGYTVIDENVPVPVNTFLETLKVDGVAVPNFTSEQTEYTVNIAPNKTQVDVEYTVGDADTQVKLIQPVGYYDPFKLVATNAEGESRTYTITCRTANDLVDNLTYDASVPETKDSRSAVFKHNLQELDPAFSDRTGQGTGAAAALVRLNGLSAELLGRDYLLAPYTWTRDHGSLWKKRPTDAGYIEKWMQFDMHRSGTVKIYANYDGFTTVIRDGVEQAYKDDGWTVAENSDGYFKALGANGNTMNVSFTRCYTKHVTVEEKPENLYIRNGSGNFIVIFDFDSYEVRDVNE